MAQGRNDLAKKTGSTQTIAQPSPAEIQQLTEKTLELALTVIVIELTKLIQSGAIPIKGLSK